MSELKTLWDHQKKAVVEGMRHRDYALLWDAGTGKTAAMINILRGRFGQNQRVMRTLILAPLVVLRNWKHEFAVYSRIKPEDIVVLDSGAKRLAELQKAICFKDGSATKERIIVTNFEALQNEGIMKLLTKWQPEVLVVDEAHRCKNHSSLRAKKVYELAQLAKHRYILTGTPILNSGMDIFQQYKILDLGETFGRNFFVFRSMYFEDSNAAWSGKHNHFPKYVPRPEAYDIFNTRIYSKGMRVEKRTCISLPDLVLKKIDVPLSKEQLTAYKAMEKDFIAFVETEEDKGTSQAVVAQLAITKALRLMQIATGFANTEDGECVAFKTNPRITALKDILSDILEQGEKVIIWCVFKENYAQVRTLLESMKVKYAQVHGEVKDKQEQIDLFRKDPDCMVMIANQKSGGIGINLIEASYAIFFSRNFSLEDDNQARARNYRGGSDMHERVTQIDLYAAGTIEEMALDALLAKQNIANKILSLKEELKQRNKE